MNIIQKITLWALFIVGMILTFVFPFYTAYSKVLTQIPNKDVINFVWLIILGILTLSYFKYFKTRVRERLNARATSDEFGVQGTTNPIVIRLMKAFELLLPTFVIGLLIYSFTLIPGQSVWEVLQWLSTYLIAGQIVFGIKDYMKWIWMIDVEAKRKYKVEERVKKLKEKHSIHYSEE